MNAQFQTVRFNNRRYNRLTSGSAGAGPGGGAETGSVAGQLGDLEPVDNCINSVLGQVSIYRVDQKKGRSQKTKSGHGGVFSKKNP